jgi:Rieske Fe-S protein
MNRKTFIKSCGFACLGGTALAGLLESCSASRLMDASISGDDLIVPVKIFEVRNGDSVSYKKYITVQHDLLLYPVCIYRENERAFSALWMQCTHQGASLQVFGDTLQCPAHGSEFNKDGTVQNGPALQPLRKFPVVVENNLLKISLKVPS